MRAMLSSSMRGDWADAYRYRNIMTMISYIQDAQSEGAQYFPNRIPGVLQLQDMIEKAWNMGYNSVARIETGGIRNTRKYIGTPEVGQTIMH